MWCNESKIGEIMTQLHREVLADVLFNQKECITLEDLRTVFDDLLREPECPEEWKDNIKSIIEKLM